MRPASTIVVAIALCFAGCSGEKAHPRCGEGEEIAFSDGECEPIVNINQARVFDDERYKANVESAQIPGEEIYYGEGVAEGELTAVVAIPGGPCSGNLISERLIITARHCCKNEKCVNLNSIVVGKRITAAAESIRIVSVEHAPAIGSHKYPDALLATLERAPIGVEPVNLAPPDWIDGASVMRIAGYGKTDTGVRGVKMKADTPIASKHCDAADVRTYGCVEGLEIVTAPTQLGADSCSGDSGGGAFVTDPANASPIQSFRDAIERNEYALGAVTRQSIKSANGVCGYGTNYFRLDGPMLAWIEQYARKSGQSVTIAGQEGR
ncbi:MAG: trypsin-like serine protease [Parvularculaceae bacterium]